METVDLAVAPEPGIEREIRFVAPPFVNPVGVMVFPQELFGTVDSEFMPSARTVSVFFGSAPSLDSRTGGLQESFSAAQA